MTRSAWFAAAAAVLIVAAGAWFYSKFERVHERQFVGYQGEAAHNPLLALTRLMERMGLKARPMEALAELDRAEPGGTLVLPRERRRLTAQGVERMLAWVGRGGHLIVEAEPPRDRDQMLDALGVARRPITARLAATPSEISFPHATVKLRVLMDRETELAARERRMLFSRADANGTLLLHFPFEQGRVTVLPSFGFMRNASIGEHDHAAFAWELLQLVPSPSTVLIARRFERPSLAAWLAREARAPLFASAALLALWLWRVGTRFGPLEPEREGERRRLLDHLRASGLYLWSAKAGPRLLAAAREACLQKIVRTQPALADLPPAERVARFAALTQLDPVQVEQALLGEAQHPHQFTAAVRTLQQIEEKLTRRVGA